MHIVCLFVICISLHICYILFITLRIITVIIFIEFEFTPFQDTAVKFHLLLKFQPLPFYIDIWHICNLRALKLRKL